MDKQYVQENFNNSSKSYDSVALVQKECAYLLVELLLKNFPNFFPLTVADVGAGTGYVTEYLLRFYPNSRYLLNDFAPAMLDVARDKFKKYSNISYNISDMETLNVGHQDLIISNFAMQWVTNLEKTIQNFATKANTLVFSTLHAGTFQEWTDLYNKLNLPAPTLNYPTQKQLESYCLSLNPKNYLFLYKDFSITFDTPLSFVYYLRMLGANTNVYKGNNYYLRQVIKHYNIPVQTSYKVFFAILNNCTVNLDKQRHCFD